MFPGPQTGKGFANVPVCLFAAFLIGVFQGKAQLCLLQSWCQGQQHLSWALGKRGCSVPTAGKGCGLYVCPIWQTVLIPEICPQDCPKIAQTLLLAILLPSGKPDNFSQPDLVSLVPKAASALWFFCVHMLPFCLELLFKHVFGFEYPTKGRPWCWQTEICDGERC